MTARKLPLFRSGGQVFAVAAGARPVGLAMDEVLDPVTESDTLLDDRASLPGVRPDLGRAAGASGGRTSVHLATDAVFEPLLQ